MPNGNKGYTKKKRGENKPVIKPDVVAAVEKGITKDFIDKVSVFGQEFDSSNSQVRNIFSAVKRLQMRKESKELDKEAFLMLRPRLAYAVKRSGGKGNLDLLKEVLSPAVDAVVSVEGDERDERFERFCHCCEAIVAYTYKPKK